MLVTVLVFVVSLYDSRASLTLLGVGALGLAGYGWRRRRRAGA
jgi:LPXTG-motif cell wall-anchored protein